MEGSSAGRNANGGHFLDSGSGWDLGGEEHLACQDGDRIQRLGKMGEESVPGPPEKGRKEMGGGDRRDRKKPKAGPGLPHSLVRTWDTRRCLKRSYIIFISVNPLLCPFVSGER